MGRRQAGAPAGWGAGDVLIAVDPGQHTGLAFRLDNGEWATLLADKLPDANERLATVLATLHEYVHTGRCDAVIVEEFKTMGYLSRYGIETIELVGAIKALCYLYQAPMVRQAPVQRLPFERQATALLKERSRTVQLPVSDHEISALAHLLRYEHSLQAPVQPASVAREHTGPIRMAIKPTAGVRGMR